MPTKGAKLKGLLRRLNGFSLPGFGLSWATKESEQEKARKVIVFLEDRRVLYVPSEAEVPEHCVHSVIEVRHFLTSVIGELDADSPLCKSLVAMRAACRKFLDTSGRDEGRIIRHGFDRGHYASWEFLPALGELRGAFGIHVAAVAATYGLDVEEQLRRILPLDPADDTDESTGPRRLPGN